VQQWIYPVDKKQKPQLLIKLIKDEAWYQVLIFCRTKHGSNRLATQLDKAGISSAAIHGNKSQGARTRALAEFKAGKIQALVATDIAARGLDIEQLPQVVNFDLPHVSEDYVHRIGRTGRAGAEGQAVSLVSADEIKELKGIERLIQQALPRKEIAGFAPKTPLGSTPSAPKALKPKKPKRPNSHRAPRADHQDGRHPSRNEQTKKSPAKDPWANSRKQD